jgi:hypothetical protein
MFKLKKIIPPALFLFFLASCSYDNLEEYYSNYLCDTLDVTFAGSVYPIIERNCLGCHYNGNSIGVELETYSDIVKKVGEGRLLGALRHEPGFAPMPRGNKLDDCSIAKIEIWVANGAPEN